MVEQPLCRNKVHLTPTPALPLTFDARSNEGRDSTPATPHVPHGADAGVIQDRLPSDAAAGGLPDPAGRSRDIDHGSQSAASRIRRFDHGDVRNPSAHDCGADRARRNPVDERCVR